MTATAAKKNVDLILHEVELSYPKTRTLPNIKITSSKSIELVLREQWRGIEIHESFYAVHLNRANNIMGLQLVSIGGIDAAQVDIRIIMAACVKGLSTSLILAHNHPTGNMRPSMSDKQLTKRIQDACAIFKINLLDHIILHPEHGYFSFADEGVL